MDDLIELGPECQETYFCTDFPELAARGVRVAGLSALRGHYRVEQRLNVHLVEITLGGHGRGSSGAWRGALRTGSVLCVPAGTRFCIETDAGAPWSTAWAHLDPRLWRPFPSVPETRDGVDAAPLTPLLGMLDAERDRDDDVVPPLKRTLSEAFALWLRRVLHSDAGPGAARQRAALQSIFDRVRSNPGEDWSSERLASLAGCSRSQLHRRCVEAFGRSPAAQVTRLKMQEAEYWLTGTGAPLKVVADRLGYASPYHFSTAFKRHTGVAPAVYRAGGRSASGETNGRTTASSRET